MEKSRKKEYFNREKNHESRGNSIEKNHEGDIQ
jgi:hypothetical protein